MGIIDDDEDFDAEINGDDDSLDEDPEDEWVDDDILDGN